MKPTVIWLRIKEKYFTGESLCGSCNFQWASFRGQHALVPILHVTWLSP